MIEKILLDKPHITTYNLFKWLNECRIVDKYRPVLECFRKKGKLLQASNGYILASALLEDEPLMDDGSIIPDGLWRISSISKKIIVLEMEYGTFPDTNFLLKRFKEKDPESRVSHIALGGKAIANIVEPFDYFLLDIDQSENPTQLFLHPKPETFPEGKYVGIVMPVHYVYDYKKHQETLDEMRLILR